MLKDVESVVPRFRIWAGGELVVFGIGVERRERGTYYNIWCGPMKRVLL